MFTELNLICIASGVALGIGLSILAAIILITTLRRRSKHLRAAQLQDCRFFRF